MSVFLQDSCSIVDIHWASPAWGSAVPVSDKEKQQGSRDRHTYNHSYLSEVIKRQTDRQTFSSTVRNKTVWKDCFDPFTGWCNRALSIRDCFCLLPSPANVQCKNNRGTDTKLAEKAIVRSSVDRQVARPMLSWSLPVLPASRFCTNIPYSSYCQKWETSSSLPSIILTEEGGEWVLLSYQDQHYLSVYEWWD